MKVLQVINAYSPLFGCGPADRCQKMAAALVRRGHRVTVFTSAHSWDAEYAGLAPGVEVVPFPHYGGRFCYTPGMKKALDERLADFDVVHLMNHWTHQNVLAYNAARRHRTPFVFSAMGALPIVYRSFWLKRLYRRLYGGRILRDARAVIGITRRECAQYAAAGVPEARIHYLPNAIDAEEYASPPPPGIFRRRFSIPEGAPLVLFLGRLAHIKGPDILLDAFAAGSASSPEAVLAFVGPDYGMEAGLKARAAKTSWEDRVFFPGPLTGEMKRAAYAEAEVFVVPSRQENMSIVAVEAAASGTPVVITDACGFPEIEECGAGRVVPAEPESLRRAVEGFLKDPGKRAAAGEKARGMVRDRFTWDRIGRDLEDILAGAVRASRP
ncbi:MAG: glycosyltransferase [Planctomycetota bacterium]